MEKADLEQAARLLRSWASDRQRASGQWTAQEQAAVECAIRLEEHARSVDREWPVAPGGVLSATCLLKYRRAACELNAPDVAIPPEHVTALVDAYIERAAMMLEIERTKKYLEAAGYCTREYGDCPIDVAVATVVQRLETRIRGLTPEGKCFCATLPHRHDCPATR